MDHHLNSGNDEAEVRALIGQWNAAVRARDIGRIMACYAPEIVAYDLPPPLQFRGAEAYRADWETYLHMMPATMEVEIRDLTVMAGGGLGFSHYLSHFTGKMQDGKEMDVWMRATDCYRKRDGRWQIVHEHMSVPIDMESNQALYNAAPA